jgi:membrane peptidoglycan carboxypeptidase
MIAHRRPSYFLVQPAGRGELSALTDAYLALLAEAGEIPRGLAASARDAGITVLPRAPERTPAPFIRQKAANQIRTHLLSLFALPRLYDLDRFDLTASATLDVPWQAATTDFIERLERPDAVRALGLDGPGLLDRGDPARVIYSFTLLETTPLGNVVRIQTDNYDGPLSFAQASRVELGSTAKLRALVTYLEAIAEVHGRLESLTPDEIRGLPVARQDALTLWVRDAVLAAPGASLASVLEAAMARRYSASPAERFVTGGGTQTFANFDRTHDASVLTVTEAFRHSVNLPMIRLMRDVVSYYMFRSPETTARVLADVDDPARRDYLSRFADREGGEFVRQFYRKYQGSRGEALLPVLTGNRRLGPQRTAWALRAVRPEAPVEDLAAILPGLLADDTASRPAVEDLLRRSDPAGRTLNDLGYLARVHPLELWVVRFLLEHPEAGLADVLGASGTVRQDVYAWLFRTSRRNVQDQRIRSMLEIEAFQGILASWRRVGYPFDNIVPSFGTAIGSSGDRPVALAELVGIILNGGTRYPIVRVETLDFAETTPFETRMARTPVAGERVMQPEVAAVVRDALVDVVERGTARRARGALLGPAGAPLVVGGKTGTGDNRYRVFGPGGQLVESRPVNRTATLAFFAGDRFFGVVTAYVPGQEAGDYRFTSALPSEVLRQIGAQLGSLAAAPEPGADAASGARAGGQAPGLVQRVEDASRAVPVAPRDLIQLRDGQLLAEPVEEVRGD